MLKLEVFTEEDIPTLLSWLKGTDIRFLYQFAGVNYRFPLDESQILQTMQDPECILFKVVNSFGMSIGHCQIIKLDLKNHQASIGRLLISSSERGRGLGQQMIKKLILYATEQLNLKKITLRVFDFNESAINCYKKLNFIECGVQEIAIPNLSEKWKLLSMELVL